MSKLTDLVRRHQSVREKLTSSQDFFVLDSLLNNALAPMEAETDAYFEWVAEVAAFTLTSRRRPNDVLVANCIAGLCGAPKSAIKILASGIDRGFVFSLLNKVGPLGITLENAQIEFSRKHAKRISTKTIEDIRYTKQTLGTKPTVIPALRTTRYWYKLALKHKADIISHYMSLLYKASSRAAYNSNNRVETEHAFTTAYLTASEAVDRFRADRGVFAGYLGIWLKGSNVESAKQALGLAAPGARVSNDNALQTDGIEGAVNIQDLSVGETDNSLVLYLGAIARDPDVRAALMLSEIEPTEVTRLSKQVMIGGVSNERL